jgi:hypothetical protein
MTKLLEWYKKQWAEDEPGAIILLSFPLFAIAAVIMFIQLLGLLVTILLITIFVIAVITTQWLWD